MSTTQIPPQPTIPSYGTAAPKVPLRERINPRMLVFFVVALFLVGTPLYIYLDSVFSGGIKHAGNVTICDLKAMSNFPFDQENGTINDVPKQWRDLDGKRIQVTGEQWVTQSAGPDVDRFDVVYSIAKCCFNGPPQIQHFVHATVKDGGTVPYLNGLVEVTGVLKVDVKRDKQTGKISQVYAMEVESVKQL